MRYGICAAALGALLLVGCAARGAAPEKQEGTVTPPPQEETVTAKDLGRDETTALNAAGQSVDALLQIRDGYSIYIPRDGFTLKLDTDDAIPQDCWEADGAEDVSLTVYYYKDMSTMVARSRFLKDCDYTFEDLTGGSLGDPLCGTDGDGDATEFMVAESTNGTTYVIAWEDPAGDETYAPVLSAAAESFQLME